MPNSFVLANPTSNGGNLSPLNAETAGYFRSCSMVWPMARSRRARATL
jgi:hypothetical protein